MVLAPKQQKMAYGMYVDHEKEISFPSRPPLLDDRRSVPETVVIGNYRISFLDKVFGGYEVNIVRTDGTVIARNAKISRFSQKQFNDPSTDTTVYIKLSLCDGAIIMLTAFEEATPEEIKRLLDTS
jgi:hypothetical protein